MIKKMENPLAEIKVEYDGEDVKSIDLPGLVIDMKLLKDIILHGEEKLGYISDNYHQYFEGSTLGEIRLLFKHVESAKTCVDKINCNLRVQYNLGEDDEEEDEAISKLLLKHDFSMDIVEDGDHQKSAIGISPRSSKANKRERDAVEIAQSRDGDELDSSLVDSYQDGMEQIPNNIIQISETTCPRRTGHKSPQTSPRRLSPKSIKTTPKLKISSRNTKRPKKTPQPRTDSTQPDQPAPVPKNKGGRPRNPHPIPKPEIVTCDICHKQLAYKGLTAHKKRSHQPQEFTFVCTHCPRSFATKGQLTAHTKIHSEVKPFVCDVCGWSFHSNSNLLQHKRRHLEDRPLKCPYCDDSFRYNQSLNTHVQSKHTEKSHQCAQCGKVFGTVNRLKRHEDHVHQCLRKYPCTFPECGKSFKRSRNLKYHINTHNNPNSKFRGLNKPKA